MRRFLPSAADRAAYDLIWIWLAVAGAVTMQLASIFVALTL